MTRSQRGKSDADLPAGYLYPPDELAAGLIDQYRREGRPEHLLANADPDTLREMVRLLVSEAA